MDTVIAKIRESAVILVQPVAYRGFGIKAVISGSKIPDKILKLNIHIR